MPNINEIIPKQAIEGIKAADTAIIAIDNNVKKLVTSTDALAQTLKKGGVSFSELAKQQKAAADHTKSLSDENKKLAAIQKKVDGTTNLIVETRLRAAESLKKQKLEAQSKIQTDKKEGESINALRQRNKQLLDQRNKVNTANKKGQTELKRLNTELDKNNKTIKQNSDALSKQKQNVGNYSDSILDAAGSLGFLGGVTQKVTVVMGFFSMSLKTLRGALMATGIGALVVALGSLAAYFQSTEEGAAKLQKIITPFKILFFNLRDAAADLGEKLLAAFDNPKEAIANLWEAIKQNLMNRLKATVKFFKAFGDILQGVFSLDKEQIKKGAEDAGNAWLDMLTGVEDTAKKSSNAIADFVKKIATETRKETAKQTALIDAQLSLDKKRRAFLVEEAKLQSEIADLILLTRDAEGNRAEQKQALIKAEQLQKQISEKQIGIAEEQLRIKKEEASLSKSGPETLNEIAELERQVYLLRKTEADKVREIVNRQVELQNKVNAEIKKGTELLDKQAKAFGFEDEEARPDVADDPQVQAAAKRTQAIIDMAKKAAKETNAIETIKLSELDDLYEKELITFEEYEAAKNDITQEGADKRLDIITMSLAAANQVTDIYFQQQKMKLDNESVQMSQQKAYELELAAGNQEKINEINEKYAKKEAALKTKQAKQDKKAALIKSIINTAIGITASAALGFPAAIPGIIFTAALGALQQALIIAQPIPQFYKGTESAPGGVISVGEKGRELIETKSGKLLMATQPTLTSGMKGAKIYSNPETEAILNANATGHDSQDLRATLERNNNRLIETIKNKRELHINSRKGTITDRRGNYYRTYKSRYFN